MSTSGSTDFSLTARQIITFALRKLNVCAQTEDPSSDDAETARIELNLLLKEWGKHDWLWALTEGSVSLVAADADYTLSSVPHKIISARYRDANNRDIPMVELSREEYFSLPDKTSSGTPTQFYYDRQRAAVTLYVWPVPSSVTTETIRYTYRRKLEDIDDLANDIDVRQEYEGLIGYYLAKRLGPDFGVAGTQKYAVVAAEADRLLAEARDEDREDYVQFIPERRW